MAQFLINRRQTRKFILEKCRSIRRGWQCTRVSEEALMVIDAKLRSMIISMIEGHPSIGRTFRP